MSELRAVLDLPLGQHAATDARHAVEAVLRSWDLSSPAWLFDAVLVVSELVTNAIRHAGGCLELRLTAHDRQVTISVADGTSVIPRRRASDTAGGRGLTLIEAAAQEWGVEDHHGGKRVWVRMPPCPAPD